MIRASAPYHGMKSPSAASSSVPRRWSCLASSVRPRVRAWRPRGERERQIGYSASPAARPPRRRGPPPRRRRFPVVLLDRQHRELRQAQRRDRRERSRMQSQRDASLQLAAAVSRSPAEMQAPSAQQLGVGAPGAVLGLEIVRARGRRQHRIGAGGPGHRFARSPRRRRAKATVGAAAAAPACSRQARARSTSPRIRQLCAAASASGAEASICSAPKQPSHVRTSALRPAASSPGRFAHSS